MAKANVNGVNIDYDVCGQGEPLVLIQGLGGPRCGQGEPLVLIQGLGGPRSGWIFQTRAFSKYYRVITLDNRGVGKSDKPSQPYTVRTMADDIAGEYDGG